VNLKDNLLKTMLQMPKETNPKQGQINKKEQGAQFGE
jgi:hypothetical protein